jgi:hypothetical protein
MTICTNPPGALVYVDDYEIGTTPVSTNFTYYGPRKIRLVKDGYETKTLLQPVPAPWYQYPPLDFITENLVPGEVRDQRVFNYQLSPQMVVPTDQIIQRAEGLRRQVQTTGAVTPQPGPSAIQPEPIPTPPPQTSPGPPSALPGTAPPGYRLPAPGPQNSPPAGSVPMHTLPPGGWLGPGNA